MFRVTHKVQPIGFPPVSKTLPQAVKKIAKILKPEKIILFGSYVYGNPTPDSDVDLLVIMKTRANTKERYLAVSGVLSPRQFPVDIIVKTPQEVREALQGGTDNAFFIRKIFRKGKPLYEKQKQNESHRPEVKTTVGELKSWIEIADKNFAAAKILIRSQKSSTSSACLHAQQCAEKYLKAMLILKDVDFPKTSDLPTLNALCNQTGIVTGFAQQSLVNLTKYEDRPNLPTLEDAKEAIEIAQTIRNFSRAFLGLK